MAEGFASRSSVCGLCLCHPKDARLLTCLHSFCKTCIDDLHLKNGHRHEVVCPLCREKTHLPDNGASGLCKDIFYADGTAVSCDSCRLDDRSGTPELLCSECGLAFCKEHVGEHIISSGHAIALLCANSQDGTTRACRSSTRPCDEHDLPLRYYCKQCGVFVCGDCTAVGNHKGHRDIVRAKKLTAQLAPTVLSKMHKLKKSNLLQAEQSLSNIDEVSTKLSARAKRCRCEIRDAGKRAIDTILAVVEQKVAEVDDLEVKRSKELNEQRYELKRHADSLKSCIAFGEKSLERNFESADVAELLMATNNRAEELDKVRLGEKPIQHSLSRLAFKGITDEELLEKANEIIGSVWPCEASPACSSVDSECERACVQGSHVTILVCGKDGNGEPLREGGDVVDTTVELPENSASDQHLTRPCIEVIDTNNGLYKITFSPKHVGEYTVKIFINGCELQKHVVIWCLLFGFDQRECQHGNMISEDQCTVTRSAHQSSTHKSVLGSQGMSTGRHQWKVKITRSKQMSVFAGVAKKPGLTACVTSYYSAYSWWGADGDKMIKGKWTGIKMDGWHENDVLQFELDCDLHVLSITNLRSQDMNRIHNLPIAKLFPYFTLYDENDTLTLVL